MSSAPRRNPHFCLCPSYRPRSLLPSALPPRPGCPARFLPPLPLLCLVPRHCCHSNRSFQHLLETTARFCPIETLRGHHHPGSPRTFIDRPLITLPSPSGPDRVKGQQTAHSEIKNSLSGRPECVLPRKELKHEKRWEGQPGILLASSFNSTSYEKP